MERILSSSQTALNVARSRVLVVGAGGVGCELLKDLVTSQFADITLVDLDIIDASNLNRQFLFRREHVGQPKATIAAHQIKELCRHAGGKACHISAIVGNILESRFDTVFFSSFDVVCNALDNLEARRHVNRMCIAAKAPMIESGSTGYLGQVSVIDAGRTECYDCYPKPVPKSYAVCTIRSTPDKPVHCVVWAKLLVDLLFGVHDQSNLLSDLNDVDDGDAEGRDEKSRPLRWNGKEDSDSYARRVAQRVFFDDILQQRQVAAEAWKEREPPKPIDVAALVEGVADSAPEPENGHALEFRVWDVAANARMFLRTMRKIVNQRASEIGSLVFDKDDDDLAILVTTIANLRAAAYDVPLSSAFQVKGIAGNIVQAIATTNAVVAGLIVLEALAIVGRSSGDTVADVCRTTYVQQNPSSGRSRKLLLQTEKLQKPKSSCRVCARQHLTVELQPASFTLGALVDAVLRDRLGFVNPGVSVTAQDYHNVVYESGHGLDEDELEMYQSNREMTLEELQAVHGARLEINDYSRSVTATIYIVQNTELDKVDYPDAFKLEGTLEAPDSMTTVEAKDDRKTEENASEGVSAGTKRKRSHEEISADADGVVVILDEESGNRAEDDRGTLSRSAKAPHQEPLAADAPIVLDLD